MFICLGGALRGAHGFFTFLGVWLPHFFGGFNNHNAVGCNGYLVFFFEFEIADP